MHRPTVFPLLRACSQLTLVVFCCTISASAATAAQAPAAVPPAQNSTKTPAPSSAVAPSTTSPGNSAAAPDVTANSSATVAPAPADKPKKVWTNEDVSGMKGPISVVGDARNSKGKTSAQNPPDPSYVANVRKQLQKLQEQMADADKELAGLKNFSEGEPVATPDRELHKSYNSQPIDQQMNNLQTKKKELQSKIDALLDEARKKGVEPGQLR
jgi:hypothetical protein